MKKLALLILPLALTGCATTAVNSGATFSENGNSLGTHYLARPARQAQLSAIRQWSARGNIAIHTEQKGWNASFNWQQQGENYNLVLFGPLGTNRVQLIGSPQQVTLQSATRTVTSTSAETLLQQQLGWSVPVSNLYYWLRGMPAPGSRARQSYDLNNHIVQLTQDGWHIIYLRYISVNGVDVPNRLLLSNPRLQVRVLITQWDF